MKQIYLLFLLGIGLSAKSQNVNIPDTAFKNALVNTLCIDTSMPLNGSGDIDADSNNDGEIQVSEALAVTNLRVPSQGIASLEGIKEFANLQILSCEFNQLTTLDVSGMMNLKHIICYTNLMTSINIDGLENLESFIGGANHFTALDFSHTKVTSINLGGSLELTHINIKNGYTSSCSLLGAGMCAEFFACPNLEMLCVDESEVPVFTGWIDNDPAIITTTCSALGNNGWNGKNFSIYPNPAKNEIYLDSDENTAIAGVSIYNALGQLVKTVSARQGEAIDIASLDSGTYFVKIDSDKGKTTRKLIKI